MLYTPSPNSFTKSNNDIRLFIIQQCYCYLSWFINIALATRCDTLKGPPISLSLQALLLVIRYCLKAHAKLLQIILKTYFTFKVAWVAFQSL